MEILDGYCDKDLSSLFGALSDDYKTMKDLEKELQKMTDDNIKEVDRLTDIKEKELFAI